MLDTKNVNQVILRSLERVDLSFVHQMDNNQSVMRYWFEEPYAAYVELEELYDKHIHDQTERRFILEDQGERVGLIELVEINHIHRTAEFGILIVPEFQGRGYATRGVYLITDYAFCVLNLRKLFLEVDEENEMAIRIYERAGFAREGRLVDEYFSNGSYRTVIRMCIFQEDFFRQKKQQGLS